MDRIYLDYAATTPMLPSVREAMAPWLGEAYGNPSSLYAEGRRAKEAIDSARETLSTALGCLFAEVLFTSSGTEAANLAIIGAALANTDASRRWVMIGAAEHHCVLHTQETLEALGYRVETIPVDRFARVKPDALEAMLGPDVLLVSVMHANNELGTLLSAGAREDTGSASIPALSQMIHGAGALFHCDAVQTFLSVPWKVADLDADLVTISAHKVYGPKGAGAIYIRAGVKLKPLIVGGGQERGMRAGTENVAAIAGFAEAVRSWSEGSRRAARDAFLAALQVEGLFETVPKRQIVLPGHAHVRIPGINAETMLILLDRMGVGASSGAACSSGSLEPSHVLLACGHSMQEAREGLRFTFGRDTSVAEAVEAADRVNQAAGQIRRG